MILKNGTRVEIFDTGSRVTLPDGAVIDGAPHDTDAYRFTARELGYRTDTLQMCRDHDPLHCLVADWLGFPASYAMLHAAGRLDPADQPLADAEEAAVLALQRLMRLAGAKLPAP